MTFQAIQAFQILKVSSWTKLYGTQHWERHVRNSPCQIFANRSVLNEIKRFLISGLILARRTANFRISPAQRLEEY